MALQLVVPSDDLVGIAVEGLSPADQEGAPAKAVEVADLTLYHGKSPSLASARAIRVVQLKYSLASDGKPYRAADAKETVEKFATAYSSFRKRYGEGVADKKLSFELVTNRPVLPELAEAIAALGGEAKLTGVAREQARQFTEAAGLARKLLASFARTMRITGLAGSLEQNRGAVARTVVDWSAAPDANARARLAGLRHLVRTKAGSGGQGGRNVIRRVDVLDALEVQDQADLFPCESVFPEVGEVVDREQLPEVVALVPALDRPLVVHAAGGVGKTVFLRSLANRLGAKHKAILFDCFGGGAYRAPDDARHLPGRGLIHIANVLAGEGLCDPLLPMAVNAEEVASAFRRRLQQAVATLRRASRDQQIILILDAADNAAEIANERHQDAFPSLLLRAFFHRGSVDGVKLVVSCRTYRRELVTGDVPCREVELRPFSYEEAEAYLRARVSELSTTDVQVAWARSEGNPRVLEHLALGGRGLLDPAEAQQKIAVDELIEARITTALDELKKKGTPERVIGTFLAGLAVLPPPVPAKEYADAHGLDVSEVKSFVADLYPLLENTGHGLIFRDEPTETFVRRRYAATPTDMSLIVENLLGQQDRSMYAAAALPGLLENLGDGQRLFALAFDERLPESIASTVGKLTVRYARLKAATRDAARRGEWGQLVRLLVELSTLASISDRGSAYLLDGPDLVVASTDADATRRLFETRTAWPGTRHARLAIASMLAGDKGACARHAVQAAEWLEHFYRGSKQSVSPEARPDGFDFVAIPFRLVCESRVEDAVRYLEGWPDWFSYDISTRLYSLLAQARQGEVISADAVSVFVGKLEGPGTLAAALAEEVQDANRAGLISALGEACVRSGRLEADSTFRSDRRWRLEDGILKAAAIAILQGRRSEALQMLDAGSQQRPRLWSFAERLEAGDVYRFLVNVALRCAAREESVSERAILPEELNGLASSLGSEDDSVSLRKALEQKLNAVVAGERGVPKEKRTIGEHLKRDAERFLAERLEPVLSVARALYFVFSAPRGRCDLAFQTLGNTWSKLRLSRDPSRPTSELDHFFDQLGRHALLFAMWARDDVGREVLSGLVAKLSEEGTCPVSSLIEMVSILARRPGSHDLAGRLAKAARQGIEGEDEVGSRASLFADLARAVLPSSAEECVAYFRLGLEQLDAIGSGDYRFTNELLLFAAEARGQGLEEPDFHALSNICELNMPYEEEKFPWGAFGRGLGRVSGLKSLARLGRWDDREKVSLEYTLLPYLTALVEQDKVDASVALGLLRLVDAAEAWGGGTPEFTQILEKKNVEGRREVFAELLKQFLDNKTSVFASSRLASLAEVANRELGSGEDVTAYLTEAAPLLGRLADEVNSTRHSVGGDASNTETGVQTEEAQARRVLEEIAGAADPADAESLSRAVERMNAYEPMYRRYVSVFFEKMRERVGFAARGAYVRGIAGSAVLSLYFKLMELKECRRVWAESSSALEQVFAELGTQLVRSHPDEFVSFERLDGSDLKGLSDISGVAVSQLAMELASAFAQPEAQVPASVWLGLATSLCDRAPRSSPYLCVNRTHGEAPRMLHAALASATSFDFSRDMSR